MLLYDLYEIDISEQEKHGPKHKLRGSHEFTYICAMDFPEIPLEKAHIFPWIGARHREIARFMVWDLRMAARLPGCREHGTMKAQIPMVWNTCTSYLVILISQKLQIHDVHIELLFIIFSK